MGTLHFACAIIVVAAIPTTPPPALIAACAGFGNVSADWLTAPCAVRSQLVVDANGSTFTLRNGIVARTLRLDGGRLTSASVRSEASGEEKLAAVVPEATFEVNGVAVAAGGDGTDGAVRLAFAGYRTTEPVAGGFAFAPGVRGSRRDRHWPPAGVRVEFDHAAPCAAVGGGAAGTLTATVIYELFDGTSAFGKRVGLAHTCADPLFVFNMTVSALALVRDKAVETFTDASIAEVALSRTAAGATVWVNRFLPVAAGHAHDAALPAFGPGLSWFRAGESFTSYLCVELVHDAPPPSADAPHGMSRFGLEAARMWRTLAPQTEQFPVAGNAMCVGGADLRDPRRGHWCYDAAGTAGLEAYIDQAAAVGFELVHVSLNMNNTWRSLVGNEFESSSNISWFKSLVDRARASGIEVGAYQLLRNARSATALSQCAPDNAAVLPNAGFDDQDLPPPLGTGLPCHNGGVVSCRGGPGCCSLCAGTEFYDAMEASMFAWWDATGQTAVEQDGAESDSPCANASHARHHGLNDSVWVKWGRVHDTFRGYMARGGFVQGMPGHWLEGGQAKVPGGYDEMTWSLPRWTWLHRQRERMIADPQWRDRTEPNALRYFVAPFTPYHPVQVLPSAPTVWSPVVGLQSTATLEPLEDHVLELEWALSQSFGTGIYVNFRGSRLFAGPASKAAVTKWVAWFKRYRDVLGTDFVTLGAGTTCWGAGATTPTSTCTVTGWDAVLHRSPAALYPDVRERGLAVVWNPLNVTTACTLTLPLYYAGLDAPAVARVRQEEGEPSALPVGVGGNVTLPEVALAPLSITYFVVEA